MPVPVCARVSKPSVRGDPKVVMLPLLVNADEGEIKIEPAKNSSTATNATPVSTRVREVKRGRLGIQRSFQDRSRELFRTLLFRDYQKTSPRNVKEVCTNNPAWGQGKMPRILHQFLGIV